MNSYGKNRALKTIALIVVSLLLVGAIAATIIVLTKKNAGKGYIQDGMLMQPEATIRLNDPTGVRFSVNIEPELYREVEGNENKTFGIMIAPLSYYLKVDTGNSLEERDWINDFKKVNQVYIDLEDIHPYAVTNPDGTLLHYQLNGVVVNVKYKNTNLEFLGIAYVKTVDGENVSYKYAGYPDGVSYKECAYSFAYLAGQSLNENEALNTYYSETDLVTLNKIINDSVDLANGLEEPTDDNSKYTVTLTATEKTLKIDETYKLEVKTEENLKVPLWYRSSDPFVAEVKDGVITAKNPGTAEISVFVAGTEHKCMITVESAES